MDLDGYGFRLQRILFVVYCISFSGHPALLFLSYAHTHKLVRRNDREGNTDNFQQGFETNAL